MIQAFDTYCIGEVNITYERYTFNSTIIGRDNLVFWVDLCLLAGGVAVVRYD